MYWGNIFSLHTKSSSFNILSRSYYLNFFVVVNILSNIFFQIKMSELTFVNVESEPVEVKEECAEEEDPLSVSLSTKGKKYMYK